MGKARRCPRRCPDQGAAQWVAAVGSGRCPIFISQGSCCRGWSEGWPGVPGTGYRARGGQGTAGPSPSALRRAFACQARPPSHQAGLTPAGPERAQVPALTFNMAAATRACPSERLVSRQDKACGWSLVLARWPGLGGCGAAAGGAGGLHGTGAACVTGLFVRGCNLVGVLTGLSVSSPRVSCNLQAYLRAQALRRCSGSNPFETAMCPLAPCTERSAAGLGEMRLPLGKSHGLKVGN